MTKEDFAEMLNGRDRTCFADLIRRTESLLACESGLVIVFGASDNLMEFRGALYDEKGVYGGCEVYFEDGEIYNHDGLDEYKIDHSKLECLPSIKAIWCPKDSDGKVICSWMYETKIEHVTFDVFEDGDLYCRGIIFDYAAIGGGPCCQFEGSNDFFWRAQVLPTL